MRNPAYTRARITRSSATHASYVDSTSPTLETEPELVPDNNYYSKPIAQLTHKPDEIQRETKHQKFLTGTIATEDERRTVYNREYQSWVSEKSFVRVER